TRHGPPTGTATQPYGASSPTRPPTPPTPAGTSPTGHPPPQPAPPSPWRYHGSRRPRAAVAPPTAAGFARPPPAASWPPSPPRPPPRAHRSGPRPHRRARTVRCRDRRGGPRADRPAGHDTTRGDDAMERGTRRRADPGPHRRRNTRTSRNQASDRRRPGRPGPQPVERTGRDVAPRARHAR